MQSEVLKTNNLNYNESEAVELYCTQTTPQY